jgi:undecaprenyl-diphosphatase
VITFLNDIDHKLFLFLNGIHFHFLDPVMYYSSKGVLWVPLYLVFLFFVIRRLRWQALLVILFAALMITVSDQLCNLSKDYFHRLRPSYEPGLTVHLVNAYKGGLYGFYSAHASNTFAIAVFLSVLTAGYFRFFWILPFLWALFMSYTRIYLGVHYPGDILTGMIVGSLLGFVSGKLCLWISCRITEKSRRQEEKRLKT